MWMSSAVIIYMLNWRCGNRLLYRCYKIVDQSRSITAYYRFEFECACFLDYFGKQGYIVAPKQNILFFQCLNELYLIMIVLNAFYTGHSHYATPQTGGFCYPTPSTLQNSYITAT